MKNKYGFFGNLDQTCRRQAGVPLLIVTLIVAVGLSVTGCPDSVQPQIPIAVSIVTVPANTTTVTRGVPLPFAVAVLPATASQRVTWNVNPADAGTFNAYDEFIVSPTVTHGAQITITATALGTNIVSNPIDLTVNANIESVSIATVPPGVTTVTVGVPLSFTATVLPEGAPQVVAWHVSPAYAGTFNAYNQFMVSYELAHGDEITITATVPGTEVVSSPITLTVDAVIESVNIETVPAGATTVTRGEALLFDSTVLPAWAPQEITWNISPENAGTFNAANEFTVSPELAHGQTVTITAMAYGTNIASNPIELTVNVIPTGVNIATVPPDATTVTADEPLSFVVNVLPTGAPQGIEWRVSPPDAGEFNIDNELMVCHTLVHGTLVTVRAVVPGTDVESDPIELTVNVIPTGVNIATVPAGVAVVTRGVALPFTVNVLPAEVPQYVTWNVNPAGAGAFDAYNRFTVSDELAHGATVTVTATAAGTVTTSAPIELTVNVIPTSVEIATIPPGATIVVRGVELPFAVNVLPAGAPQEFEWRMDPDTAGVFDTDNVFTVSADLAHDTSIDIWAVVPGADLESNLITLLVNAMFEGVEIATVPPDTQVVTRGIPLQFIANVLPADAPQYITWNVNPAYAGAFDANNVFTVSDELAHGATVTITAAVYGIPMTSDPINLTVNVIPTGVDIATYPPNRIHVTRDAPLAFVVNVSPEGAPQNVTWNVPANAGGFNAYNEFVVSETIAYGETITIMATAYGTDVVSNEITLTVLMMAPIEIEIEIEWGDFEDRAPVGGDIDVGAISVVTGGNITLSNVPSGIGNADIRWYLGGSRIGTGATLELRSEHLGTLLGPRFITLVVMVNGQPYSKRIAFTVTL